MVDELGRCVVPLMEEEEEDRGKEGYNVRQRESDVRRVNQGIGKC